MPEPIELPARHVAPAAPAWHQAARAAVHDPRLHKQVWLKLELLLPLLACMPEPDAITFVEGAEGPCLALGWGALGCSRNLLLALHRHGLRAAAECCCGSEIDGWVPADDYAATIEGLAHWLVRHDGHPWADRGEDEQECEGR